MEPSPSISSSDGQAPTDQQYAITAGSALETFQRAHNDKVVWAIEEKIWGFVIQDGENIALVMVECLNFSVQIKEVKGILYSLGWVSVVFGLKYPFICVSACSRIMQICIFTLWSFMPTLWDFYFPLKTTCMFNEFVLDLWNAVGLFQ